MIMAAVQVQVLLDMDSGLLNQSWSSFFLSSIFNLLYTCFFVCLDFLMLDFLSTISTPVAYFVPKKRLVRLVSHPYLPGHWHLSDNLRRWRLFDILSVVRDSGNKGTLILWQREQWGRNQSRPIWRRISQPGLGACAVASNLAVPEPGYYQRVRSQKYRSLRFSDSFMAHDDVVLWETVLVWVILL